MIILCIVFYLIGFVIAYKMTNSGLSIPGYVRDWVDIGFTFMLALFSWVWVLLLLIGKLFSFLNRTIKPPKWL